LYLRQLIGSDGQVGRSSFLRNPARGLLTLIGATDFTALPTCLVLQVRAARATTDMVTLINDFLAAWTGLSLLQGTGCKNLWSAHNISSSNQREDQK
jgi:hypothetical protein